MTSTKRKWLVFFTGFTLIATMFCHAVFADDVFYEDDDGTLSVVAGTYYLRNAYSDKYMEASDSDSGSNVYQNEYNGTAYQRFTLRSFPYGSGVWIVPACNTDLRLHVAGGDSENGANIDLATASNVNSQQFRLQINSDRSITLISQVTSEERKVVELENFSSKNKANVDLWTWNGGSNQKWILEPVSNSSGGNNSNGARTTTTAPISHAEAFTSYPDLGIFPYGTNKILFSVFNISDRYNYVFNTTYSLERQDGDKWTALSRNSNYADLKMETETISANTWRQFTVDLREFTADGDPLPPGVYRYTRSGKTSRFTIAEKKSARTTSATAPVSSSSTAS